MILKDLLKLWHPFVPFVTETIWKNSEKSLLLSSKWPTSEKYLEIVGSVNGTNELNFEIIKSIISSIRNARTEYKIKTNQKINVFIYAGRQTELIQSQENIIKNLGTEIATLNISETGGKISKSISISTGKLEIHIPLEGVIDFEKEKIRLEKELSQALSHKKDTEKKISNKKFVSQAPKEIVQKEKVKLASQTEKIEKIKTFLKAIE